MIISQYLVYFVVCTVCMIILLDCMNIFSFCVSPHGCFTPYPWRFTPRPRSFRPMSKSFRPMPKSFCHKCINEHLLLRKRFLNYSSLLGIRQVFPLIFFVVKWYWCEKITYKMFIHTILTICLCYKLNIIYILAIDDNQFGVSQRSVLTY